MLTCQVERLTRELEEAQQSHHSEEVTVQARLEEQALLLKQAEKHSQKREKHAQELAEALSGQQMKEEKSLKAIDSLTQVGLSSSPASNL